MSEAKCKFRPYTPNELITRLKPGDTELLYIGDNMCSAVERINWSSLGINVQMRSTMGWYSLDRARRHDGDNR